MFENLFNIIKERIQQYVFEQLKAPIKKSAPRLNCSTSGVLFKVIRYIQLEAPVDEQYILEDMRKGCCQGFTVLWLYCQTLSLRIKHREGVSELYRDDIDWFNKVLFKVNAWKGNSIADLEKDTSIDILKADIERFVSFIVYFQGSRRRELINKKETKQLKGLQLLEDVSLRGTEYVVSTSKRVNQLTIAINVADVSNLLEQTIMPHQLGSISFNEHVVGIIKDIDEYGKSYYLYFDSNNPYDPSKSQLTKKLSADGIADELIASYRRTLKKNENTNKLILHIDIHTMDPQELTNTFCVKKVYSSHIVTAGEALRLCTLSILMDDYQSIMHYIGLIEISSFGEVFDVLLLKNNVECVYILLNHIDNAAIKDKFIENSLEKAVLYMKPDFYKVLLENYQCSIEGKELYKRLSSRLGFDFSGPLKNLLARPVIPLSKEFVYKTPHQDLPRLLILRMLSDMSKNGCPEAQKIHDSLGGVIEKPHVNNPVEATTGLYYSRHKI